MGGAMVASDSWYTAVYYNPAGMAYQEDVGLSVGVNYLNNFPKLNIDFGEEQIDRGERDQGLAIGFSTPLGGGKISKRIFIGFGAYLPYPFSRSVTEIRSFDPSNPYFIQYENRNRSSFFTTALSFRAWRDVAFSIGTEVLVRLNLTQANIIMNDEGLKLGFDALYPLDFAPTLGMAYRPRSWLTLGLAYHGKTMIQSDVDISLSVIILDEYLFPVRASFVDACRPQQIDAGIGFRPIPELLLAPTLTWADFSDYVPPVVVFEEMGGTFPTEAYHFQDYWIPRIGLEYFVLPTLAVRAGYFYRNSSVSAQTGETSFIDCPTHGVGVGAGYNYNDPLGIIPWPVYLELAYQAHVLEETHADKPGDSADFWAKGTSHFLNVTLMYNF